MRPAFERGGYHLQHYTPSDIENSSMRIITQELADAGIVIPEENAAVVKRVIHATADFDFARNLVFTDGAVLRAQNALAAHTPIVTDTNMALSGVSRPSLEKLGCGAYCFMADPAVAEQARANGTTRAVAAVGLAAERCPNALMAVGNAPTALFEMADRIENGLRPALVIAVPVGFVNVIEGKERIWSVCGKYGVPAIVARGRKGGSTVAAAVLNALLYSVAGTLDPKARGWL